MSKELAKAVRAGRTEDAPPAPAATPAPRESARPRLDLADAHAALGNSVVAAHNFTRPPALTPADALRSQAGFGNSAVSRAASAGEFGPPELSAPQPAPQDVPPAATALPVYMPSFAPAAANETPAAAPLAAGTTNAFDATTAPFLASPLLMPPLFGPPLLPPFYTIPPAPAPAPVEGPEEVSTIVFEEEEIVAGAGAKEQKPEEKAAAPEAVKEDADKAQAQAKEQAEKEAKGEEAKPKEEKKGEEKKKEGAEAVPSQAAAAEAKKEAEPTAEEKKKAAAAGGEVVKVEPKEAKGVEAAGEATAPTPAPAAAGTAGDPELAQWDAKVSQKTKEIKADAPQAQEGKKNIRAAGTGAVFRAGGARKKQQTEAEKIVEPPPPVPDPLLPPEQDAVPKATALMREASDRKLPNQTMPPLVKTPGDIMPEPPRPPSGETATKATTASEMELDAQEKAATASGNKKEIERVKKARKAREKQLKLNWAEGKGEPLVLIEEPAPPPAPMTKQTQADIGKVLAQLSIMQEEGVKQIVTDARGAAYTGQVMQLGIFDPVAAKLVPEVNTYLGKKIEAIGEAAGFKKEDLERQVAARKEELAKRTEIVHGGLTEAASIQKEKVKDEHQQNTNQAAGVKKQADNHIGKLASEITFRSDPTVIRQKRDQLVTAVGQKIGQQTAAYTQAGERRVKALGETLGAYIAAYAKAGQLEEAKYFKAAKKAGKKEDEARAEAEKLSKPTFDWIYDKLRPELTATVQKLQGEATLTASGYVNELKTSASTAIELIGEWADHLTGHIDGFWNGYEEETKDWEIVARESAAAWEASQSLAARDALVRDIDQIRATTEYEEALAEKKKKEEAKKLDDKQKAVQDTALGGEAGQKDAILTVAQQLKDRLSAEQRPALVQKLEAEVEKLEDKDWPLVEAIARAESPGADALHIASEVYKAAKGIGTDEDRIYRALASMTPMLTRAVRMCYRAKGYGDIDERLDDELSGAEYDRAKALMDRDQGTAGAAAIRYAIFPGAAGGDVSGVLTALKSASPADLRAKFKKEYGYDLDLYLKQSLSGEDYARAQAILTGDKTLAYAAELKHAVGDEDRKGVESVYSQIRADVEAEAAKASADVRAGKGKAGEREWDTARIEAEVKKRAAEVEAAYDKEEAKAGIFGSSLKEDIEKKFEGDEKKLALALTQGDRTAADVARLKMEDKAGFKQGVFGLKYVTGDQKTIIKVLEAQGQRARAEAELDEGIKLREKREAFTRDQQIGYLRGWTTEQVETRVGKWDEKKEREQLKKNIEEETKTRSKKYMGDLKASYDQQAGTPGSLDSMLSRNITGTKGEKAQYLVNQGGILTPEQTLHYAVVEEDADAVKDFLGNTPQEEMKTVEQKWRDSKEGKAWLKAHEGKTFEDFITADFEGRDLNDIKVDIKGAPATPHEALDRKKAKLDYEKTAYGWAAGRSPEEVKKLKETFPNFEESDTDIELRNMEDEYRRLEEQVARLDKLQPGTPQYELEYEQYKFQTTHVEQSITNYRDAVDFETDRVAMIAGIIATALVVVLTAGAATPLLIAAAAAGAAAAGAAATILAKQLMKGSAYTRSEMMTDIVVGAVDALVSAATAGLGGKLLKAFGPLAKMAKSPALAPRLLAHGLAEGAENFLQSIPTSLAQQMMDKRSEGVSLSAAVSGAAIGAALGGLMGSVGGFKKPAIKATAAVADSADLLIARGTAAERQAAWQSFRKANPGKGYKEFLGELDAGLLARQADEEAVRQAQRQMRRELFTDIPHAQRGKFKDVPIEVLSDGEFEKLTRSKTGQAVILIEEGKPRVLMRESADPKVLREEGIHLLQSADPSKAHLFKELDEKVLSKWDKLPLDQQIGLYSKKLDLEIDGQQRLIKNLEGSLAAAGDDPVARRQILDQLEEARETLDNLSKRLDEVGELTPTKRLDIASGKEAKPDFLEQPARLFAKKDRMTIKRELVASLKAAGHDASEAKRVLENLRVAAKQKGQKGAFDALTSKLKKMPPADAKALIDDVGKAMNSWGGDPRSILGIVESATKVKDARAFLGAATKIAATGKDAAERVTTKALDDIARKLGRLDPASAHKYLDDLGDVLDAFAPRKPRELSGFLRATAKIDDSKALTSKLRQFANDMKQRHIVLPEKTLTQVGDALGKLDPPAAARYLDALNDFTNSYSPGAIRKFDGFLMGSRIARSGDPAGYLAACKQLIAERRNGLSQEALEVLAHKAGRTTKSGKPALDVQWLVETDLFKDKSMRGLFDFMAADPKTSWNLFRRAAKDPANQYVGRLASARVRGIVGEYLTFLRTMEIRTGVALAHTAGAAKSMKQLKKNGIEEIVSRQTEILTKLGRTEIDFRVRTKLGIHGLEVKTYSKEYWMQILEAWDMRSKYKVLTKAEMDAVGSLDHMIKQLKNGASLGNPPFLMTSDLVDKIGPKWRGVLQNIFKNELPPGTVIVKLSEADIGDMTTTLRKLLGM